MRKSIYKLLALGAFLTFGFKAQANIDVTCILENCLAEGWHMYDQNRNQSSVVTCIDGDCTTYGWRFEANGYFMSEAICKPDGCFTEGWVVYDHRNRIMSDVSCYNSFAGSDCFEFGWVTHEVGRGSYQTRCIDGDCRNNGWDVLVNGFAPQPARCKRGGCFNTGWTIYN